MTAEFPFPDDAAATVWVERLRRSSVRGRRGSFAELSRVFLCAPAPESISGNTDIGLVATPLGLPVDAVVRAFFNSGFWLHKKFDPDQGAGINGFARWFRPLAPFVFPKGGFSAGGDRLWGVRFTNQVHESRVFPGKEVFTIDYRHPGTTLPMRPAVDEVVQLSPSVYLSIGLATVGRRVVKLLWFTLTTAPGTGL